MRQGTFVGSSVLCSFNPKLMFTCDIFRKTLLNDVAIVYVTDVCVRLFKLRSITDKATAVVLRRKQTVTYNIDARIAASLFVFCLNQYSRLIRTVEEFSLFPCAILNNLSKYNDKKWGQ